MKEIDRALSRKVPKWFAFVFAGVFVIVLSLIPRETVNAEPPASGDTVEVPAGEIKALYEAHKVMRARIAELEGQALSCAASFNGMHRPGPTKE